MTRYNQEKFLDLIERGKRDKEIAGLFQVVERTVERWRHANGLPLQGREERKSPHGSLTRYSSQGCRCAECRETFRKYTAKRRAERYALTQAHGLPEHVKHGTGGYANWGCRCTICTAAYSEKNSNYYETSLSLKQFRAQL